MKYYLKYYLCSSFFRLSLFDLTVVLHEQITKTLSVTNAGLVEENEIKAEGSRLRADTSTEPFPRTVRGAELATRRL